MFKIQNFSEVILVLSLSRDELFSVY
jgi:hypothetical protein